MIRGERFEGLDALRGIAALSVFVAHLNMEFGWFRSEGFAYLAVNVFFMLSGFVMEHCYRFEQTNARAFLQKRYLRLFPPYFVGVTLGTALLASSLEPLNLSMTVLLAVFFLPSPFAAGGLFGINYPSWSLFFELVANWLHAAIFYRLTDQVLIAICLSMAVVAVATTAVLGFPGTGSTWLGWPSAGAQAIAGYLIGIILRRKGMQKSFKCPLIGFALLSIGFAFFPVPWIGLALTYALGPFLVIGALRQSYGKSFLIAGAMSYPLYAIHGPAIQLAKAWGVSGPTIAISVLLLALLVTYAFEPRAREKFA